MAKLAFDFEECMKQGLLREIPPSAESVERSIGTAKEWLGEAQRNLEAHAYNSCILSAYAAMFHSARAILFFDGFREKSHACVARYLEAKYVRASLLEPKWVNLLDRYRDLRHEDQYGIIKRFDGGEAEEGIGVATEFVGRMEKLLVDIRREKG